MPSAKMTGTHANTHLRLRLRILALLGLLLPRRLGFFERRLKELLVLLYIQMCMYVFVETKRTDKEKGMCVGGV